MDAQTKPEELRAGIMAAEVERFEQLCSEERSFATKVEQAIQEVDRLAQRDVMYAEAKLKACQMEGATLRDRLQKAREGECPCYHT